MCDVNALSLPPNWLSIEEASEVKVRAAELSNGVGRLWRIEAPSGSVSHLYGTMHVNAPVLLDLPPELTEIIETARIIAPETDNRLLARRFARNDRFESLRWASARRDTGATPFEPELEHWIRIFFSAYGFERPWTVLTDPALAEMLLWSPCNDFNAGIFPIMDDLIMLNARIAGAEIRPLEPQSAFLRDLSEAHRGAALHGTLQVFGAYAAPSHSSVQRQAGFALYAQGRIAELMAWGELYVIDIFGKERADEYLGASNGYLLTERNALWLDQVGDELDVGGVLMPVGAFHIPGDTGLVSLLRQRGHKVTRIVVTGEVSR
ncbi:MAG: TraB/GumN family protein [Pseudomonadota bacterium]